RSSRGAWRAPGAPAPGERAREAGFGEDAAGDRAPVAAGPDPGTRAGRIRRAFRREPGLADRPGNLRGPAGAEGGTGRAAAGPDAGPCPTLADGRPGALVLVLAPLARLAPALAACLGLGGVVLALAIIWSQDDMTAGLVANRLALSKASVK